MRTTLNRLRDLVRVESPARALLVALLLADVVFIVSNSALHLVGAEGYFDIRIEQAAGEGYQYVKWIWCIAMCCSLSHVFPAGRLWTAFLAILFLDDSLSVHERAGEFMRETLAGYMAPEVLIGGIGEHVFYIPVGCLFVIALLASAQRMTPQRREAFNPFLALLCAFLFFAVFFDTADSLLWDRPLESAVELIEESAEMLLLSGLTAYLFSLWSMTGAWPGLGGKRLQP